MEGTGKGPRPPTPRGTKANPANRGPAIGALGLTAADKANLVAFLNALTDDRVRWEKAPFDHPELQVPNGSPKDQNHVTAQENSIQAKDDFITIPAAGAAGRAAKKLPALKPSVAGLK